MAPGKLAVPPGYYLRITRRILQIFSGKDLDIGQRYPGYGVMPRDYPPCNPKPGEATRIHTNYYLSRDTRRSMTPPKSLHSDIKALSGAADGTTSAAQNRDWWKASQ
ncbi:NADH dehydrogenase [ubiquinone] 1 alpha subcomplex subunit 7-like [Sycon ciliatum]|uniref:NADH dehydrogenase [ubiquinone] 1 alpha subcomplex subunit 7-like n=1 Tax=Sycon ciliatum TaxID=27933 RepID=UPI0020ADB019|eukprot:scpid98647/ scgid32079/ 